MAEKNEETCSGQDLSGVATASICTLGTFNDMKDVNILKTLIKQEVKNQLKNNPQAMNVNV